MMYIDNNRPFIPSLQKEEFFDADLLIYLNSLIKENKWEEALIQENSENNNIRKTKIRYLTYNENDPMMMVLYEKIREEFLKVNINYNFNISILNELSLLKYDQGYFYDKHLDLGLGCENRKLSMIVQLSDESEYEGGDTVLYIDKNPIKITKEFNTATFFPSYLLHEVKPIISGTRFSLVSWIRGENFR